MAVPRRVRPGLPARAGQPYWFPVRETMDPEERDAAVLVRLREVMAYAYSSAPRSTAGSGTPRASKSAEIRSLEDFERVPVITKEELRLAQADAPAVRRLPVHRRRARCTASTAPRAPPAARPRSRIGRADWEAIANAHARIMWGMGMRPGDTVFVARDLQPLHGLVGRAAGAERLRRDGFPVRGRRAGHDGARRQCGWTR